MRLTAFLAALFALQDPKPPDPSSLVRQAVRDLVKMQEDPGEWPYEGVYRVQRQIPVGYRVGGTSLVAGALLSAAPEDAEVRRAVLRGLEAVLRGLEDPLMQPSVEDAYDVRVWGHACALEFLCHARAARATGERAKDVEAWIPRLIRTLTDEEIRGGGWNYANRRAAATFVTAPVAQALLWARARGFAVPEDTLARARRYLEGARTDTGSFVYSGPSASRDPQDPFALLPGAIARAPACETTLLLLGGGSVAAVRASLEAFHTHWEELHKRWKKQGTHVGPYGVAPYYFCFGHRYAAQAIQMLPEKERQKERERLSALIMKTRDDDGTWNDRVFPRSRNYGTSMIVLALLGDKAPLPPALKK